jgi:hypothetical protein
MSRFVSEIAIPAPVYMPIGERRALSELEYYGCLRVYWTIHTELDDNGTPRPLGIGLTAELEATNLESAEDASLDLGLRFGQVLAVYSGSPLPTPKLVHLARIGPAGGLLEQYDYYYLDGAEALPRVMLRSYDLEKLLSWFGKLDEGTAYRLELAARWYGISVGAQDPLDGYLAVWVGLESVGPVFSNRLHPHGTKAPCTVCKNAAGVDRDRGQAGIEHAIKLVAPELLEGRSFATLKALRDAIAHGLKSAAALRLEVSEVLLDLQLVLIFVILSAARPDSSAQRSGRAILPREFKVYPDARAAVRSQVELIDHKPFFGEWLHVKRRNLWQRSRIESDGNYIWGAKTSVSVEAKIPQGAPGLQSEYIIFERRGRSWEHPDPDAEHPQIPVVLWRSSAVSAAWARYLLEEEV